MSQIKGKEWGRSIILTQNVELNEISSGCETDVFYVEHATIYCQEGDLLIREWTISDDTGGFEEAFGAILNTGDLTVVDFSYISISGQGSSDINKFVYIDTTGDGSLTPTQHIEME